MKVNTVVQKFILEMSLHQIAFGRAILLMKNEYYFSKLRLGAKQQDVKKPLLDL